MSKKLPWIKFYTSDWLSNYDLQMCSDTAQALWVNLICVMCNSPERGRLVENDGQPMSMKRIVFSVRKSEEVINAGLEELKAARICDIDDKGVIYSSRIVNEDADRQAEAERKQKYEETHKPERSEKRAAKRNGKITTRLRQKSDKITTRLRQESDALESESESELELDDKRERSKSPAPGGVDTPPVDNSAPLHSTQISQYHSQIEELITAIKTTGAGVCKDLDNPKRRSDLETQLANIIKKNGDPVHWLAGMNEALKYAGENPQTEAGEILAKFRQYPDGIQDNGKDSRCEQLIRVVSKAKPYGACAKFLGISAPFNPNPSGDYSDWGRMPASKPPANEEEDNQNNLF